MKRAVQGHRSRSREAGGALLVSMGAMVVVTMLATTFLRLATAVQCRVGAEADAAQALEIAEAGLAEACAGLAQARTGNVGTPGAPAVFGGGLFWVTATEREGGLVELESTALYGGARTTLGLLCEPIGHDVPALGIFSAEGLTVGRGARIDSYDSARGSQASQIGGGTDVHAIAGSNGPVRLAEGASVAGDVLHGTTATLTAEGATVTGTISARSEDAELPPVELPEVSRSPTRPSSETGVVALAAGEHGYETLSIERGGVLVLQGPLTLVAGNLLVAPGGALRLDASAGPIRLHVTGALDLAGGASVTTACAAPADIVLVVASPEGAVANLAATGAFQGFVYAPEAGLRIAASFELFGGLVGRDVVLADGARVHMDLALSSRLESRLPVRRGWRLIEPPHGLAQRGVEPFSRRGPDLAGLPGPAAAHADQVLELRYVDRDGTVRVHLGPETGFDWSRVRKALRGERDGVPFLVPPRLPPRTTAVDAIRERLGGAASSRERRDALVALGTIPEEGLVAVATSPGLTPDDLVAVLERNAPLAPAVLDAVLARDPPLAASVLAALHGPFEPDPALERVAARGSAALSELFGWLASGQAREGRGAAVPLDPWRRLAVVAALARHPHGDLVRFLAHLARESAPEFERVAALELLGRTGERPDLVLCLELGTPSGDVLPGPGLRRALCAALAAVVERDAAALRDLCGLFARTTPVTRPAIVEVVRRQARGAALSRLGSLLGTAGAEADALVLAALARVDPPAAGPDDPASLARVRGALSHPDHDLAGLACGAIEHLRDFRSVPDLIALLGASDRELAARAHRALESLTGLALRPDVEVWVRWLDGSLIWWEDRAEACRAALRGPDSVASAAAITEVAVQRLYLDEVVELLALALERPEPDQVLAACRALRSVPAAAAGAALEPLCRHTDARVAAIAREVVAGPRRAPSDHRLTLALRR